ncbi:MAG: 50S ribosomal protein L3 [Candidatus Omnitrophota bacterium]|nr:MAG: 50S ribosomal protein L3 [Candidatus Omnitrophota bacterium]
MIKEIFGKKVGMTQIFSKEGNLIAVTLLEIEPVCVLEQIQYPSKKVAKIGFIKLEGRKAGKLKKPVLGYFNKLGLGPYKFIREVAALQQQKEPSPQPEQEKKEAPSQKEEQVSDKKAIGVEIFKEGEIVDVRAKTKGKGFTGGMKRHGWRGQPRSHGSTTHRRIGSAGASAFPSRIIKGLGMPGHMGNAYRTIKNLEVVKIDKDKNLVFIKGGIPGSRGSIIKVVKR